MYITFSSTSICIYSRWNVPLSPYFSTSDSPKTCQSDTSPAHHPYFFGSTVVQTHKILIIHAPRRRPTCTSKAGQAVNNTSPSCPDWVALRRQVRHHVVVLAYVELTPPFPTSRPENHTSLSGASPALPPRPAEVRHVYT